MPRDVFTTRMTKTIREAGEQVASFLDVSLGAYIERLVFEDAQRRGYLPPEAVLPPNQRSVSSASVASVASVASDDATEAIVLVPPPIVTVPAPVPPEEMVVIVMDSSEDDEPVLKLRKPKPQKDKPQKDKPQPQRKPKPQPQSDSESAPVTLAALKGTKFVPREVPDQSLFSDEVID